ncbi:MAG TPA: D-alanyl-D-alanine carboxypeptidase family protein [Acidimicrobiales bacterium]
MLAAVVAVVAVIVVGLPVIAMIEEEEAADALEALLLEEDDVTGGPVGAGCPLPLDGLDALVDPTDPNKIPLGPLEAYCSAAGARSVDWAILAAIGKMECDHGKAQLAGCNPRGTVNSAGARGPMQFLGSTWRAGADRFEPDVSGPPVPDGKEGQGYATDGDGDGVADPWSWLDATHAAARYLVRNGVAQDTRRAVYAYNPSHDYVEGVLRWASRYRAAVPASAPAGPPTGSLASVPCPAGGSITVDSSIAANLRSLLAAAADAGKRLCGSGYRTAAQQIDTRRRNCGPTHYDIWVKPSSQCNPPTARPGTSMHERGLAIDFTCDGGPVDPCFGWLHQHAGTYGLRNLPSEPWHWSTNGR